MSAGWAVSFLAGCLAVLLAGGCWQVRRARRAGSERDRVITAARARVWDEGAQRWAAVHQVGPDALRLLDELDAHLDAYVADELAAGCDRLWAAIRDEQNGPDHTTTPEGDQP